MATMATAKSKRRREAGEAAAASAPAPAPAPAAAAAAAPAFRSRFETSGNSYQTLLRMVASPGEMDEHRQQRMTTIVKGHPPPKYWGDEPSTSMSPLFVTTNFKDEALPDGKMILNPELDRDLIKSSLGMTLTTKTGHATFLICVPVITGGEFRGVRIFGAGAINSDIKVDSPDLTNDGMIIKILRSAMEYVGDDSTTDASRVTLISPDPLLIAEVPDHLFECESVIEELHTILRQNFSKMQVRHIKGLKKKKNTG